VGVHEIRNLRLQIARQVDVVGLQRDVDDPLRVQSRGATAGVERSRGRGIPVCDRASSLWIPQPLERVTNQSILPSAVETDLEKHWWNPQETILARRARRKPI
jgi:hypothetical protein